MKICEFSLRLGKIRRLYAEFVPLGRQLHWYIDVGDEQPIMVFHGEAKLLLQYAEDVTEILAPPTDPEG